MKVARVLLSFAFALLLCRIANSQALQNPTKQDRAPVYIAHINVVDVQTGRELRDQMVVISGDRISAVNSSRKIKAVAGTDVVDGSGKYLIPGLWDMHVHALFRERLNTMFPMFVANGVLGIRDMGTSMPLPEIEQLRKETASGLRIGPRIFAAGPVLDGHPKPMRPNFVGITTPEQGREAVRRLKAGGADFIKVYSWLSRESFLAIADEAKQQKIPVAGHVPFSISALEASDAGQKSMEHLYGIALACSAQEDQIRSQLVQEGTNVTFPTLDRLETVGAAASYRDDKAAQVFAHLERNHTWQVPTLAADLPDAWGFDSRITGDARLKYLPLSVRERWAETAKRVRDSSPWGRFFERKKRIVEAMRRAGVPLLAGTDTAWYQAYTYAGFSLHDELALLVEAGLTPLQALQAATISPARFLGLEKDLGTVAKGKIANAVVLDANPLQDIHNTTRISGVFLSGKYFDRSALDKMLSDAEAAAQAASQRP